MPAASRSAPALGGAPEPRFPLDPSDTNSTQSAYWVGPRHLAGDDGRLYDAVADTLAGLGWTSLTIVRGRQEPEDAPEARQVLRSTVLHISPDNLRRAQWVLPDEPFHLGSCRSPGRSPRADTSSPLAQWSAYFTSDVPGEVLVDFLVALDARDQPAVPLAGPELVLDAVTAHGWIRDIGQPGAGATDPTFTSHLSLSEVPPLIQDGDPRALTAEADEAGPAGWQAWAEPVLGAPCPSEPARHTISSPPSRPLSAPPRQSYAGRCPTVRGTGSCVPPSAEHQRLSCSLLDGLTTKETPDHSKWSGGSVLGGRCQSSATRRARFKTSTPGHAAVDGARGSDVDQIAHGLRQFAASREARRRARG
ncbi:DUF317 domain-containing protein [Streptomyces sp. NPDC047980]|uniref:DUF317 domain-containing protein n=1 Tax=Streptomyces TaxID=1883 RepID=UPI0036A01A2C